MLTIQPINYSKQNSVKPAFGWDKQSIEEEKDYFARKKEELDEILNDEYVPESVKKPFKFFNMVANASISGLAVFGSALAISSFFKGAGAKAASSKTIQSITTKTKPLAQKAISLLKVAGKKIVEGFKFLENTKYGKKARDLYAKFEKTSFGTKVAKYTKKALNKTKQYIKKVLAPIKNVTYDGASKTTATVLGTGSGLAGGYQEDIKESPAEKPVE